MKLSGRLGYWCVNESLNFTLATRIFFWLSIELFRSRNRCRMATCDTNLTFGPFDPDLDPTSVGTRFRKYYFQNESERFIGIGRVLLLFRGVWIPR